MNLQQPYPKDAIETFGSVSKHLVIANAGFNKESGEAELKRGIAKMVSYGSLFLANPDLPRRFELNAELNVPDGATIYGGGDIRLSILERLIIVSNPVLKS